VNSNKQQASYLIHLLWKHGMTEQ